VVVADLALEPAQAVADEIGALAVGVDVSSEAAIVGLVARAHEAGGPIDLFFSNAGVPGPAGGPEAPDDELQATWEINVMAHVWAARAVLPEMTARGDGYLLSTASAAGLLTQVSALGYSMTKHAAVAVAEWLAITYGDAGIKVSCLCPQAVRTPMLDLALEDREHLLEVVTMRARSAAMRNAHLDQAVAPGGLRATEQHRVRVADESDVQRTWIIGVGDRETALRIIRWNRHPPTVAPIR